MSDELWITHQRVNKPVSVIPRSAAPAMGTPHPYPRPTASLVKGRWHGVSRDGRIPAPVVPLR